MNRSIFSRIQQCRRPRGESMKRKRLEESPQQTETSRSLDRSHKRRKRNHNTNSTETTIETVESAHRVSLIAQTEARNRHNQIRQRSSSTMTDDEARFFAEIDAPLAKVCASCGELVDPKSMKTLRYSEGDVKLKILAVKNSQGNHRGLIEAGVHREHDHDIVSLCLRCDRCLVQREVPKFSIASGFQLNPVPQCLSILNPIDARMIGIGVCFTTCFYLGPLGQSATRGNSIGFWNGIHDIVVKLLRPASRCGVIRLRKAGSAVNSLFNIRPWLLREALAWLKKNNPIYGCVEIDEDLLQSMSDHTELPTVDLQEEDCVDENLNTDAEIEDTSECHPLAESFILEHRSETNKEDDNNMEYIEGKQEEEAFVLPRNDRPMNEYSTKLLMQSCFPTLFPDGLGGFHAIETQEPRQHELKLADYCSHLMNWHDRRFVMHPTFKFFCLNIIQRRQIDGLLRQVKCTNDRSDDQQAVQEDAATDERARSIGGRPLIGLHILIRSQLSLPTGCLSSVSSLQLFP